MTETDQISPFGKIQRGMTSMSPQEIRKLRAEMADEMELAAEPVANVRDILIPSEDGAIPARIFTPENASLGVPRPILLWFHGGGMVIGDNYVQSDRPSRRVANRTGCIVVAVDFRLAPEHKYPAGIRDCVASMRWAARHGGEIGGDATRLAAYGDSGGGLAVAICAVIARDEGLPLRHQLLLYPMLDCTVSESTWDTNAKFGMTREVAEWFINHYLPDGADRRDPMVSPIFTPDLSRLASATIVPAEHDPLIGEARTYAARLQAAGVPMELKEWPDVPHSFFAMPARYPDALVAADYVSERLKAALA